MNSGESEDTTESAESVKEIVSKIKSQGIFDQFRKECLADVDTKPAYQNLRQRVESYVARFLSTQKWSSKLNKNQLRNSLRKQINQSGMLNQGVERIIDQVVNPKIFQVIKPKIDDAVCNFMGIELKQYQDQLQRRKQEQQNRQQAAQQAAQQALQPVMNVPTSDYNSMAVGGYGGMYPAGGMWPSPGAPFISPPNSSYPMPLTVPTSYDMPQFQYGWNSGYSGPAMFDQTAPMPGMVPQPGVTPVSSASTTGTTSFFPHPTNIPPPNLRMPPPTVVASSGSATPPPPGTVELTPHPGFSTPVSTSATPPPPTYSPSTVSSPGALSLLANVSSYASSLDTSADGVSDAGQPPPQPPPPPPPEISTEVPTEISTEDSDVNDMTQSFESKAGFAEFTIPESSQNVTLELASDTVVEGADENRPHFKFAWDRIVTVQEDALSDVTISSVHTSDLSSFEEDEDASDAETDKTKKEAGKKSDDEENVQEPAAGDSDSDSITSPEVTPISSPIRPDDLPEANFSLDRPCETSTSRTPTPTPKKEAKKEQASKEKTTPQVSKTKKLLSYSYKYSSDEEESREEKKIRIAKEKEERYQKRLQRRAELEAKRKEREEEKARLKEEKKKSAEKKKEAETTDETVDSKKEDLNSSLISQTSVTSQDESEGSRKRRKRKTKEEMKEQLKQQKVMERRLCRQRTRCKRYTSDEYETVFTEKKQPFSSQSYVAAEQVIEESVEVEETVVYTYVENAAEPVETLSKSPPTPTLDENPPTPTEDEPPGTPTMDEKQPPTPTMDEQPYVVELSEIPLPEQPIPIVKVASTTGPAEPFVHNTRSRSRVSTDESQISGQALSPSSDKSETAKDGKKNKKQSSLDGQDSAEAVGQADQNLNKKDAASTKSPEQAETKAKPSKRYSAEDLYKPRISHRSPPAAKDPQTPSTGLRSGKQLSSPFPSSSEPSAVPKEDSVSATKKQTADIKEPLKRESSEKVSSLMSKLSELAPEKEYIEVVVSDTESSASKASSRRRSRSRARSYRSESSGSSRRYHQRSRHRSRSRSRKRRCSVSSSDTSTRRSRKRSKSKRSHRRHRSDSRSRSSSGSHARSRKLHSRKRKKSSSSSESLDEFGRVKPKDRPSSLTWAKSLSSSADSADERDYRSPSRHHRRHTTDSSADSADTYRHSPRSRARTQSISSSDSLNIKKGSIAMEPISSDSELYSDFDDHKSGDGYFQPYPAEMGSDYQAFRDARDKTPIDQVSFGEAEKRFKRAIDRVDFGLAERHSRQLSVYEKTRLQTFPTHRRGQMGPNYYPVPPVAPFPPATHFQHKPAPEWQGQWPSKPAAFTSGSEEWVAGSSASRSAAGVVRDDIRWSLSGKENSESPMKRVASPEAGYHRTPVKRRHSSSSSLSPSPERSRHSQASLGSRGISPSSLARHRPSPSLSKTDITPIVPERRGSKDSKDSLSSGEIVDNSSDEQEERPFAPTLLSLELEPVSPDTPPELARSQSATPLSADSPPARFRRLSTSSLSESGSLSSSPHTRKYSPSHHKTSHRTQSNSPLRKHSDYSSTHKRSMSSHSQKQHSYKYSAKYSSSARKSRKRSTSPRSQSSASRKRKHSLTKKSYGHSSSSSSSSSSTSSSSSLSPPFQRKPPSPSNKENRPVPEVVFDQSLYSPIHDTDSLSSATPPALLSEQGLEAVSDTESLSLDSENKDTNIPQKSESVHGDTESVEKDKANSTIAPVKSSEEMGVEIQSVEHSADASIQSAKLSSEKTHKESESSTSQITSAKETFNQILSENEESKEHLHSAEKKSKTSSSLDQEVTSNQKQQTSEQIAKESICSEVDEISKDSVDVSHSEQLKDFCAGEKNEDSCSQGNDFSETSVILPKDKSKIISQSPDPEYLKQEITEQSLHHSDKNLEDIKPSLTSENISTQEIFTSPFAGVCEISPEPSNKKSDCSSPCEESENHNIHEDKSCSSQLKESPASACIAEPSKEKGCSDSAEESKKDFSATELNEESSQSCDQELDSESSRHSKERGVEDKHCEDTTSEAASEDPVLMSDTSQPSQLSDCCQEITVTPSPIPPGLAQKYDSSPARLTPPTLAFSSQSETPSPPHLNRQDTDSEVRKSKQKHLSPGHSSVESSSDLSPPSLSPIAAGRWRRASGPALRRETVAAETDVSSQISSSPSFDTSQGSAARSGRNSRRSSTSDIDSAGTQMSTTDDQSSTDLGRGKRHRKSPDRLSPSRQQTSPQLAKDRKDKSLSASAKKQKQTPRETRSTRSASTSSAGRETRSKCEKSPPAKRAKR